MNIENNDYQLPSTKKDLIIGALFGFIAAFLFFFASYFVTPKYVVETTLMPTAEDSANSIATMLQSSLGAFGGLAGLSGGNQAQTAEALATLQSRHFLQTFIAHQISIKSLYPRMVDTYQEWRVPEKKIPSIEQAFTLFTRTILSVSQDRQTGIVTLRMRWHDPEIAAQWLNEIVAQLNYQLRIRELARNERMIEELETKLNASSNVALRNSLSRLLEIYLNKAAIAETRSDFALQVIDPAMVPDRREYVSPNHSLFFLTGFLVGIACFLALHVGFHIKHRSSRS